MRESVDIPVQLKKQKTSEAPPKKSSLWQMQGGKNLITEQILSGDAQVALFFFFWTRKGIVLTTL